MLDPINYAGVPSAEKMFRAGDARLALSNQMTGNETPAQLVAIQALDKKLALTQIQGEVEYQWQSAHLDQAMAMRQKMREQKQRLFDMGAIFF